MRVVTPVIRLPWTDLATDKIAFPAWNERMQNEYTSEIPCKFCAAMFNRARTSLQQLNPELMSKCLNYQPPTSRGTKRSIHAYRGQLYCRSHIVARRQECSSRHLGRDTLPNLLATVHIITTDANIPRDQTAVVNVFVCIDQVLASRKYEVYELHGTCSPEAS